MKKTICVLLTAGLLLGVLSACGGKKPSVPGGAALEDSIFENSPTNGNSAQSQDPTKATEAQEQDNTTATQPTQGQQNSDSTQPTQAGSTDTTSPTTDNSSGTTEPTAPTMSYEDWQALTTEEKIEFQKSFGNDYDAFFDWYNAARDAYHAANPPTEIGKDGKVTLD